MFRNSAALLCVFLLCFGHTLSQSQNQKGEKINEKPIPVQPKVESSDTVVPEHGKDSNTLPLNGGANGNQVYPHPPKQNTTTEAPKPTTATPAPPLPTTTPSAPPSPTTAPPAPPAPPKPTNSTPPEPTTHVPSTSASPSTVPPAPSTTTPIPVTPLPTPQKGSWNVTNDKNITCIRIDGIFSIDYTSKNKTKAHFNVPKRALASGTCKGEKGTIKLTWKSLDVSNENNSLEFIFKKNETTHYYVLEAFSGVVFITYSNKTQPEHFNTNNNQTHFQTPVNQSYSCSNLKQVKVDNYTKVTLDEFHLQAFKSSNSTGFDASVDCAGSAEHTPDIVPIIVGCVLALLVIAVLVAYLISRRRSQTRGYLSM